MKLTGAVFILVAGVLLGIISLSEDKKSISALKELCNAIDVICGELSSKQSPVYELTLCAASHTCGDVNRFFTYINESLANLGEKRFSEIWETASIEHLSFIDEDCRDELIHLGDILGRYELNEQLNALNAFKIRLLKTFENKLENYPARKKLSIGVSATVSALLIIVLL